MALPEVLAGTELVRIAGTQRNEKGRTAFGRSGLLILVRQVSARRGFRFRGGVAYLVFLAAQQVGNVPLVAIDQ